MVANIRIIWKNRIMISFYYFYFVFLKAIIAFWVMFLFIYINKIFTFYFGLKAN
jgi:hypothetical protein